MLWHGMCVQVLVESTDGVRWLRAPELEFPLEMLLTMQLYFQPQRSLFHTLSASLQPRFVHINYTEPRPSNYLIKAGSSEYLT